MSVNRLQEILAKESVNQKDLYEWNAENCVFRDTIGLPEYPVIVKRRQTSVIRHVYLTDAKKIRLVTVKANGVATDSEFVRNTGITPGNPDQRLAFASMKASSQPARVPISELIKGMLVAVGSFAPIDPPAYTIGAGGTEHAPDPSYRIVGVVDKDVADDATTIQIKAYVRGEHFVDNPEIVEIPVGAGDYFLPASSESGPKAVQTFVNTALGHLLNRKDVVVKGMDGLTYGGTSYDSMDKFHAAVIKPVFDTTGGKNYARATEQTVLFTYKKNATAVMFDGAIADLEKSNLAPDTLAAAKTLRGLLFGTPTPGPTPPPPSGTLEEQVRQLTDELNASRAAREALKRERDDAVRNLYDAERRARDAEDKAAVALRAQTNLKQRLDAEAQRSSELQGTVEELRAQIAAGATPEAREALAELAKVRGKLAIARDEIVALRTELAKTPGTGPVPVPIDKEEGMRRVRELKAELRKTTAEIRRLKEKIAADPSDSDSRVDLADAQQRLRALDDELFTLL